MKMYLIITGIKEEEILEFITFSRSAFNLIKYSYILYWWNYYIFFVIGYCLVANIINSNEHILKMVVLRLILASRAFFQIFIVI